MTWTWCGEGTRVKQPYLPAIVYEDLKSKRIAAH
jgi:hypothetical protein